MQHDSKIKTIIPKLKYNVILIQYLHQIQMTTYRNINKQAKKKYGYPCNNQRYKISNIKKKKKITKSNKKYLEITSKIYISILK